MAENKHVLWIPPEFAHGFYVMKENAEVIYKCTAFYATEHKRTILWDNKDLSIQWPLVENQPPIVSRKDARGVRFRDAGTFE